MAGLEISMNADQLIRVAEQSKQALAGMAKAADQTAASVGKVGQEFDKAAKTIGPSGGGAGGGSGGGGGGGASGGGGSSGTGLAARISGVTGAMSGLRSVVGATSFSQLSFEVGKLYDDFQGLKAGLGSTATGFGALKAVMKAHPILTIASIVSAAVTAFSYLSSAIGETADSYDSLGASMRKARLDEEAAAVFGLDRVAPAEGSARAVIEEYKAMREAGNINLYSLSRASGRPVDEIASYMANLTGEEKYYEVLRGRGAYIGTDPNVGPMYKPIDTKSISVPQDIAGDIMYQRYYDLNKRAGQIKASGSGTASMFYGPTREEAGVQAERIADEQRQAALEAQQAMEELKNDAKELGNYMGDAFYNAVSGAQSLRQVVSSIISDFARMASRQAFSGMFQSIAGGFGGTASQGQFQGPPTAAGVAPGPGV